MALDPRPGYYPAHHYIFMHNEVKEDFKLLKNVRMFEKFVGDSPANIAVSGTRCTHGEKLDLTFTEMLSPSRSGILMYRSCIAGLQLHVVHQKR